MGRIRRIRWAGAARRTIPDRLEPPNIGCYEFRSRTKDDDEDDYERKGSGGNSVCIHCSNILERPFRLARFIGSGVCSNEK